MSRAFNMLPIGEVLGQSPRCTGQRAKVKVRRHSRLAGREGVFWRPISRQESQRILYAAKRFERVNRPSGSRTGPLGSVALEVLELLTNLVAFRTGQLDPSLETIMHHCRRSKDAVVRALANLRAHGFLDWLRRYVPADRDGAGPQVQQTTNAYRLSLPARAAALVGRWFGAPPPDDDSHRRETQAAEAKAQAWNESPLAAAVERLGQAMKDRLERESAQRSESQSRFNI
jgi:hypothetical protein